MLKHKTTVFFHELKRNDEVSKQARYLIRQAVALANAGIDYSIDWGFKTREHGPRDVVGPLFHRGFGATLTVENAVMPEAKPLPKEPKLKVAGGWKPKIWDAEYQLDAWFSDLLKRKDSGMVIAHSCGLAMVKPYASEEWDASEDITKGWRLTHIQSGLGFGLDLNFTRCIAALLMAAGECADWTGDADAFKVNPDAKRAYRMIQAQFGKGYQRENARHELERAAA